MAGDHKQLPPKPAYYPFERDTHGEQCFHLGRSLFKRLVDAGVEYGKLRTQSRMHPQLADVVRAVGAYGNDGYIDNDVIGNGEKLAMAAAHVGRGAHYGPFWTHAAFWWTHEEKEEGWDV
jgi:hypothetical protein